MNPFNREAGDTPAPTEPLAIDVARRAATLVARALPYIALRYGERGRRFALSDAGWLVTLIDGDRLARRAQLEWLAHVLAPRGMPSWLLELQLRATARVARRAGWAPAEAFAEMADDLAAARRRVLPDADVDAAVARFAARAGRSWRADGTARMIASAHVDVALGRCPSVAPLVDWLRDRAPLPEAWRVAVVETSALVAARLGPR